MLAARSKWRWELESDLNSYAGMTVRRVIEEAAAVCAGVKLESRLHLEGLRSGGKYYIILTLDRSEKFTHVTFKSDYPIYFDNANTWREINDSLECGSIVPSLPDGGNLMQFHLPVAEDDLSVSIAVQCVEAWGRDLDRLDRARRRQ